MDGYTLQNKLRRARRRHHLSAPTQALYYELVAICNEEEWADVFKCSNDELTTALNISEKSLTVYRQELITSGLIYYRSGQSKKKVGTYSFTTEINNGCKIYNQSDNQSGGESDNQSDNQSGKNGSDLIKTKTETKLNSSLSQSGEAPQEVNSDNQGSIKNPGEKEEKKSAAQKKEEKGITPHWQLLVSTWIEFYTEKFIVKPTFNASAAKNLKSISDRLKVHSEQGGFEWTEEVARSKLFDFLEDALQHSDWLKRNFLLANIASQFDAIINPVKKLLPNGTHCKSFNGSSTNGKNAGRDQLLEFVKQDIAAFRAGKSND